MSAADLSAGALATTPGERHERLGPTELAPASAGVVGFDGEGGRSVAWRTFQLEPGKWQEWVVAPPVTENVREPRVFTPKPRRRAYFERRRG